MSPDAEARVHAVVRAQVEQADRGGGERASGGGDVVGRAGEREDRPVVVRVAVQIEERRAGTGGQRREDGLIAALADVDDALEAARARAHGASVPAPGRRCGGRRLMG